MTASGSPTQRDVPVLVAGFWLGGWAWDEVAGYLRDDGCTVHALTLPGLERPSSDRSAIALEDHINAVTETVSGLGAGGTRICLVGHSGAGAVVYGACL